MPPITNTQPDINSDVLYTQRGSRPDLAPLANMTQLDLRGYAFARILPIVIIAEKGGTYTFAPKGLTTAQGQKGRNQVNGAIEETSFQGIPVTFTTAMLEGRSFIPASETPGMGGIALVDEFGAMDCGRKALNTAEADCAAMIFSPARLAAAVTMPDKLVVQTLQKGAKGTRGYGRPYLVMSTNAFLDFCEIPEIRVRATVGALAMGDMAFLAMEDEKVRQGISTLMKFAGVILFDSEIVGTTYDQYVAVINLREEAFAGSSAAIMTAKRAATYGLSFFYIPKGASQEAPFLIESADDRSRKCNVYDATGNFAQKEIHPLAVKMFKFADEYTEYKTIVAAPSPVG